MKKKNVLYLVLVICLPLMYVSFGSNSNGITGKSTSSCTPCHSHVKTPATQVTVTGIPSTGYFAGQTYAMTVTVTNSNYSGTPNKSGFNITVNNGTLTAGTGMNLTGTQELAHNAAVINSATGAATWNFDWTAPALSIMTSVVFSAAGNATNGDFGTGGDAHNNSTTTFLQAPSAGPSISGLNSSGITDVTATIDAMINARGASTAVAIEYGLTTAYGSTQAMNPNPVMGAANAVTANLTGLSPNTTYHYRVNAVNTIGTANSVDSTFKTAFPSAVRDVQELKCVTFPNPVSDMLEVKLDEEIVNSDLTLYTIKGKEVITQITAIDTRTIQINVSKIAKGIYILKMDINGKMLNQQIVVK